MKFKYKKYGHRTLRPVIPIKIINREELLDYEVLVDSGADICIFDQEIGGALGLEVKKGRKQEVFGIGGKASFYYLHDIEIEVGGWRYEIEAGFMPTVSGRTLPYGVVGQRGFFEFFTVRFDLQKESIELKRK